MSERDELAQIWADAYEMEIPVIDAILTAGYRKPRTITTAEELDAMPTGAVVVLRDSKGAPHPAQKGDYGWCLPFVDGFWDAEKLMSGCESAEVVQ